MELFTALGKKKMDQSSKNWGSKLAYLTYDGTRKLWFSVILGKKIRLIWCFFFVFQDSFTGKDFVDWAVDKKLISREKAVFMGKQLVSKKFGTTTDVLEEFMVTPYKENSEKKRFKDLFSQDDSRALYKLSTSDAGRALNAQEISKCVQRPANEIAEGLRRLILKLFADFLSKDGKYVDYKGIATSKHFEVSGPQFGLKTYLLSMYCSAFCLFLSCLSCHLVDKHTFWNQAWLFYVTE